MWPCGRRRSGRWAADHQLVLATCGRLHGAAGRLDHILGRSLERECGISHLMFEVLLLLGRAGEQGLSMRAVAQEQVLTTGGVTRLVDRMAAARPVERAEDPGDRRGRPARLTPLGAETAVRASQVTLENIQRYFLRPLPAADRTRFAEASASSSTRPETPCPGCLDLRICGSPVTLI